MADTDREGVTRSDAPEDVRGVVDESVHVRGGPLVREAASIVGSHLPETALVHGSLPSDARDLDLLLAPTTLTALVDVLPRLGFERYREDWVLVDDTSAVSVSLTSTDEWELGPDATTDLFACALALDGYPGLVRPAPHHDLLVLARRLAIHPGPLTTRHRARIEAATRDDPAAWERAASSASAWACDRALAVLRDAVASEAGRVGRRAALAARAETWRHRGASRAGALVRSAVSLRPRPVAWRRARRRRGAVVALSGIDGSGKSTQARLVAEALWALGHETVVEWSRITFESSLERIARPVKAVLGLRDRRGGPAPGGSDRVEPTEHPPESRARSLRERSRLIGGIWAGIVAGTNGWTLRRTTLRHLRAGRIVVRDRYVLDSVVQLEWGYANGRDLGWQGAIIRRLAPRPVAAYYLQVAPEHAHGRKPEEFDVESLRRHTATYSGHTESIGVAVVDGERSEADVFAEVLRDTLARLATRRVEPGS